MKYSMIEKAMIHMYLGHSSSSLSSCADRSIPLSLSIIGPLLCHQGVKLDEFSKIFSPSDISWATKLSNRRQPVTKKKFCKILYLAWFLHGPEVSRTNTQSFLTLSFREG